MLKAVFVGSKNAFNNMLVHWLSQRVELRGVIWTLSWRATREKRLRFAKQRLRRYGLLKMIDEALFFAWFHAFLEGRAQAIILRNLYEPYWAVHGLPTWRGDTFTTDDVNAPDVLTFVRERAPDVLFAMCLYNHFGGGIRSIAPLGVLVWHEGITPEYKGLYAPFWAVHNLDFERIGYTLLRMNDRYDAGEILVQGRARDIDPYRHSHAYLGHKAIVDSLPEVERLLMDLERGTARPIQRQGAQPGYYTLPGFSDYLRQRFRLARVKRKRPGV